MAMRRLDYLLRCEVTPVQKALLGWNFATVHRLLDLFEARQQGAGREASVILDQVAKERTLPLSRKHIEIASEYLREECPWSFSAGLDNTFIDARYTGVLTALGLGYNISLLMHVADRDIQVKAIQHMLEHYDALLSHGTYSQPCATCTALDTFYSTVP